MNCLEASWKAQGPFWCLKEEYTVMRSKLKIGSVLPFGRFLRNLSNENLGSRLQQDSDTPWQERTSTSGAPMANS